jgi:leucine dehydrogenase
LHKDGVKLYISDLNEDVLKKASDAFGAIAVSSEDMISLDVDIFAPCAMGGILNDNTIPNLKCQIVAGAANNQLEDETVHGDLLKKMGIVYAPDFVINSGGLINVYSEYNGYVREIAMSQTEKIYDTILDVNRMASELGLNNQIAAIKHAEKRINDMRLVRSTY